MLPPTGVVRGSRLQQLRRVGFCLGERAPYRDHRARQPLDPLGGRTLLGYAPVPQLRARRPVPEGSGDPSHAAHLAARRVHPDPLPPGDRLSFARAGAGRFRSTRARGTDRRRSARARPSPGRASSALRAPGAATGTSEPGAGRHGHASAPRSFARRAFTGADRTGPRPEERRSTAEPETEGVDLTLGSGGAPNRAPRVRRDRVRLGRRAPAPEIAGHGVHPWFHTIPPPR